MTSFDQWCDENYEKLEKLFLAHEELLKSSGIELPYRMEHAEFDYAVFIYDNYVLGVPIDDDGAPLVYEELNSDDEQVIAHECEEEPDVDDESDDDPDEVPVDDDDDDDDDDDADDNDDVDDNTLDGDPEESEADEIDESEINEEAERQYILRQRALAASTRAIEEAN